MKDDDDLQVRPGRVRSTRTPRTKPFLAQALASAERAGGLDRGGSRSSSKRSTFGRGRAASLRAGRELGRHARMVTVKARVVRHRPGNASLSSHLTYLRRDGVTRDGAPGQLFDATGDAVDANAFSERCGGDRHHFRFIVAPEDAAELSDLRTYTRDLMATAESDLGSTLDWVAVDHWNTEHPHVHVLVRGRADDGDDLVISRDYIGVGFRTRASERATLELGPRSEHAIRMSLEREVEAERWTQLDRRLGRDAVDGVVDLRPRFGERPDDEYALQIGRMRKLERLGLAEPLGPGRWQLSPDVEPRLRELQQRGDVVARLHDALGQTAAERGTAGLVVGGAGDGRSVLGRLVARGLDDELTGSAFVVIDGVDGRTHHVAVADLEAASDAPTGAIVEARWTTPAPSRASRLVVAVRSDFDLDPQVAAEGATWLDRQLVANNASSMSDTGFGASVQAAMAARADHLVATGLAERRGSRVVLSRNLLSTPRNREIDAVATRLATATGLIHRPSDEGENVAGIVRQRVALASGRFAMIDDGVGFQLVPWTQPLDRKLGQHVSGVVTSQGGVTWTYERQRGLSL